MSMAAAISGDDAKVFHWSEDPRAITCMTLDGVASDERRRLTLEALASTRYLPPSTRWDALQHRELLPLVETVAAALDSELKRLRAMQSLKSM